MVSRTLKFDRRREGWEESIKSRDQTTGTKEQQAVPVGNRHWAAFWRPWMSDWEVRRHKQIKIMAVTCECFLGTRHWASCAHLFLTTIFYERHYFHWFTNEEPGAYERLNNLPKDTQHLQRRVQRFNMIAFLTVEYNIHWRKYCLYLSS